MKRAKPMLATLAALAGFFILASPAYADSFRCDGDPDLPSLPEVPAGLTESNPYPGAITIIRFNGDCQIANDIVAQSSVVVTVENGKLETQKLISKDSLVDVKVDVNDVTIKDIVKAGTHVRVLAGPNSGITGNLDIQGDLTVNATETQNDVPEVHGNVLLRAFGNIKTKNIITGGGFAGGGAKTGGVQIDAHQGSGQNVVFTIGADTANGVNGTINTETVTGGATNPFSLEGGVRIKNGVPGSTGGITLTQMNKIKVRGSQSRSGFIQLHAQDGVLKLPSGRLNADAIGGNKAGNIVLTAKTIETEDGTIISASQEPNDTGSVHQIVIAAEEIKFKGTDGLKILADGNGVSQSPFQPATVYVLPKGGIVPTSTGDATASPPFNVFNLEWTTPFNGQFFQFPGKVHFNGEGSAPLLISNNGDHTQLAMTGYPLNFTGGDVTIRAKGNINHQIVMGYFGTYDGTKGLFFDNTGLVKIDASGKDSGNNGGRVQIQSDVIALKASAPANDPEDPSDPRDIVIKANGPMTGNGNGGQIFVIGSKVDLDANTKIRIKADAAPAGAGNAIVSPVSTNGPHAVTFFVTDSTDRIALGGGQGAYKITATGGFTGGNGGSIKVTTPGEIRVRNAENVIDVSARGPQGNGGQVKLESISPILFIQNANNPSESVKTAINAEGGISTGIGGYIEIPNAAAQTTATLIPALNVNALMHVDGGGRIKLNGVDCQQSVIAQAPAWPRTLWTCDGASNASAAMLAAANSLPQALKDQLGGLSSLTPENPYVHIYGFTDESKMSTFFKSAPPVPGQEAAGLTIERIRVSGVFETAVAQGGTFAEATGQHELGHQFEYIWGNAATNDAGFVNAYNADIAAFNALPCASAFPAGMNIDCNTSDTNIERLLLFGLEFNKPKEAFSEIFQHVNPQFNQSADLATVLDKFTNMVNVLQMRIANPPAPQQ